MRNLGAKNLMNNTICKWRASAEQRVVFYANAVYGRTNLIWMRSQQMLGLF